MSRCAEFVLWFEECDIHSVPRVGGKCASLGELLKAEIPVPPGYAITTDSYWRFIEEAGIKGDILRIVNSVKNDNLDAAEDASAKIRGFIENASISIELEDFIGEYYRCLSNNCNFPAVPSAVRSSATAEDMPDASFAGQQDTFLWIRGIDDILSRVKQCWSSLYTSRAIAYRNKMGYSHDQVGISVAVQKMVKSFTAGVMFTINPATGDISTIAIDANWGFGESVVCGETTPDHFIINKVTFEIIKRNISHKECLFTLNQETHSVEKREIPLEKRDDQCILDTEAVELARIGKLIEKHYGKPMDIEWAIDKDLPQNGQIMILQSRPETVWSQKKNEPVYQPKSSAMDHIVASLIAGKKLS